MRCYYCELEGGPGGTRYGIREAVAICAECGAGVLEARAPERARTAAALS
jgi:hypothetical protein